MNEENNVAYLGSDPHTSHTSSNAMQNAGAIASTYMQETFKDSDIAQFAYKMGEISALMSVIAPTHQVKLAQNSYANMDFSGNSNDAKSQYLQHIGFQNKTQGQITLSGGEGTTKNFNLSDLSSSEITALRMNGSVVRDGKAYVLDSNNRSQFEQMVQKNYHDTMKNKDIYYAPTKKRINHAMEQIAQAGIQSLGCNANLTDLTSNLKKTNDSLQARNLCNKTSDKLSANAQKLLKNSNALSTDADMCKFLHTKDLISNDDKSKLIQKVKQDTILSDGDKKQLISMIDAKAEVNGFVGSGAVDGVGITTDPIKGKRQRANRIICRTVCGSEFTQGMDLMIRTGKIAHRAIKGTVKAAIGSANLLTRTTLTTAHLGMKATDKVLGTNISTYTGSLRSANQKRIKEYKNDQLAKKNAIKSGNYGQYKAEKLVQQEMLKETKFQDKLTKIDTKVSHLDANLTSTSKARQRRLEKQKIRIEKRKERLKKARKRTEKKQGKFYKKRDKKNKKLQGKLQRKQNRNTLLHRLQSPFKRLMTPFNAVRAICNKIKAVVIKYALLVLGAFIVPILCVSGFLVIVAVILQFISNVISNPFADQIEELNKLNYCQMIVDISSNDIARSFYSVAEQEATSEFGGKPISSKKAEQEHPGCCDYDFKFNITGKSVTERSASSIGKVWVWEEADNTTTYKQSGGGHDKNDLVFEDTYKSPSERTPVSGINDNLMPILSMMHTKMADVIDWENWATALAYVYYMYAESHDVSIYDKNSGNDYGFSVNYDAACGRDALYADPIHEAVTYDSSTCTVTRKDERCSNVYIHNRSNGGYCIYHKSKKDKNGKSCVEFHDGLCSNHSAPIKYNDDPEDDRMVVVCLGHCGGHVNSNLNLVQRMTWEGLMRLDNFKTTHWLTPKDVCPNWEELSIDKDGDDISDVDSEEDYQNIVSKYRNGTDVSNMKTVKDWHKYWRKKCANWFDPWPNGPGEFVTVMIKTSASWYNDVYNNIHDFVFGSDESEIEDDVEISDESMDDVYGFDGWWEKDDFNEPSESMLDLLRSMYGDFYGEDDDTNYEYGKANWEAFDVVFPTGMVGLNATYSELDIKRYMKLFEDMIDKDGMHPNKEAQMKILEDALRHCGAYTYQCDSTGHQNGIHADSGVSECSGFVSGVFTRALGHLIDKGAAAYCAAGRAQGHTSRKSWVPGSAIAHNDGGDGYTGHVMIYVGTMNGPDGRGIYVIDCTSGDINGSSFRKVTSAYLQKYTGCYYPW